MKYFWGFIILFTGILFWQCNQNTEPLNQNNTPNGIIVVNTTNSFTATLNARQFSDSREEELNFQADSAVVSLTIIEFQDGNGKITLFNSAGDTLFTEDLNQNKVIVHMLSRENPVKVKMNFTRFSGKLSFTVAGKMNNGFRKTSWKM